MNVGSIGGSVPMERIASGSQINRAADNPAGLSISKQMDAQIQSSEMNLKNVASMDDLTKTAEGSLATIQDNLSRIKELAVQAGNGTYGDSERKAIQEEIQGLKEGISNAVSNTEFNTMKLLDGTFNGHVAINTDGSGNSVAIANTSLESLGIDNFDVTTGFDISDIETAMDKVSESRSKLGSASNAFEHASNSISNKISNTTSSMSQISDADIAQEVTKMKKNQILEQVKMYTQMQKSQQEQEKIGAFSDFRI